MTVTPPSSRTPMLRLVMIAALCGAVAGLAAVYGIGGLIGNGTQTAADSACRGAVEKARALSPLVGGEVAAFAPASTPRRMPELSFRDRDGKPVTLSDLRGRTVLVNLWATWCVPCRKEMPALDELQAKLGGSDFEVVAINLDTGGGEKPRKFLNDIAVHRLAYYEDPSTNVFQELKRTGRALGLPTTLLVDRQGCELGILAGPAEWASEDALKLLRAAIGG